MAPLEKFSFELNDWSKWLERWDRFRITSELDKTPNDTQVATLIYSVCEDADEIFSTLALTEEERRVYDIVKAKFDSHFIIKRNVADLKRTDPTKC